MSAGIDRDQLRLLVREVVRDAMTAQGAPVPPRPASAPAPAGLDTPPPTGPLAADRRSRTDTVRIGSDAELGTFVRNLLQLFENPKTRADLRAGRLTFRLAGTPRGSGAGPTAHRVERGAVTERHIAELGDSGATLILGPRAVLTPLARERARALGITISKERT
mgnify:FL=1